MYKNFETIYSATSSREENKQGIEAGLIRQIINKNSDLKDEIVVVKMPSGIITDTRLLTNFVDNIKVIADSGAGVVLVHDYAGLIEATLELFGIDLSETQNIIDHKTTQLAEMVLSGYINKRIVSFLCNSGCKAVGISGKDGYLIESRRSCSTKEEATLELGFTGEPIAVNTEILYNFLDNNIVTVVSPISFGLNKVTHILDPDMTAAAIAAELSAKHLIFLTELGRISISGEGLKMCTLAKLRKLYDQKEIVASYEKIVTAAQRALENSTKFIYIGQSQTYDSTLLTIFTDMHSTKVIL